MTRPFDALLLPPGPVDHAGTVLMGRYRLERLIARGGMGSVYLAEHLVLHGRVAVKLLNPGFAHERDFVARFLQEARATSQIGHPNIVRIIEFGREGDLVFMVMEYLDGRNLGALILPPGGPLGWPRLGRIVLQIASALAAAHRAGVIHRDVKPSNCVCTVLADGTDLVKVVDFGIAKTLVGADLAGQATDSPHTTTGVHMGTIDYMAPEIFRSQPPAPSIDVYALGVLMYKMLTGELPFPRARGESPHAVVRGDPPDPSGHPQARGCPPEAGAIVRRALESDPARRFRNMDELAGAIEASLRPASGEPITEVRGSREAGRASEADESSGAFASEAEVTIGVRSSGRGRWRVAAALAAVGATIGGLTLAHGAALEGEVGVAAAPLIIERREHAAIEPLAIDEPPPAPPVEEPSEPTESLATAPLDGALADDVTPRTPLADDVGPSPSARSPSDGAVKRGLRRLPGLVACAHTGPVNAGYELEISPEGKARRVTWIEGKGYGSETCVLDELRRRLRVGPTREGGRSRCVIRIREGADQIDELECDALEGED